MDKGYQENWDFYFTNIEGSPASVFVNLGLNKVIPVASNTEALTFFLEMQNPAENGFSSKEESGTLFEIEDKITPVLESKYGAIFAGRMTYDGSRLLYYYLKNSKGAKKSIDNIMKEFSDYDYSVETENDPGWEKYSNYLYPHGYELHSIMNRHIVENLIEKGDDTSEARNVDHFIYFEGEHDRQSFIDEVLKMGYDIKGMDRSSANTEHPYSLKITRKDPVTFNDVTDYTSLLYDIAEDNNGIYDGWETMMLTK